MKIELGFYKIYSNVEIPKFSTEYSACFDICSHLITDTGESRLVTCFGADTMFGAYSISVDTSNKHLTIPPNSRCMIPTGLIAKIPDGYSLRVHIRSGIAMKRGLTLANGEGIIDSDYYHELMLLIYNPTNVGVLVSHNERICQAELILSLDYSIGEIYNTPIQTSNRVGGFGSTGN